MAVDENGEKVALKTFKIFDIKDADVSIGFCYCKRVWKFDWVAYRVLTICALLPLVPG